MLHYNNIIRQQSYEEFVGAQIDRRVSTTSDPDLDEILLVLCLARGMSLVYYILLLLRVSFQQSEIKMKLTNNLLTFLHLIN